MRRPYYDKGWHFKGYVEDPSVDVFLAEVIAVCKKHGMSIGHEDGHGCFEIVSYDESNSEWLRDASSYVPPSRGLPLYENLNDTEPKGRT